MRISLGIKGTVDREDKIRQEIRKTERSMVERGSNVEMSKGKGEIRQTKYKVGV